VVFKWLARRSKPEKIFEFRCHECGEIHRGSPSFSSDRPPLSPDIGEDRIVLDTDTCVLDDEEFFIRGLLEIPIHGVADPFTWGLWVSQSEESFERYVATYDQDQSNDGSFGWLAVTMPGYYSAAEDEPLEVLGCDVFWREPGVRPLIVPKECDHPLYRDVADGICWDRAMELASLAMHSED